MMHRRWFAWLGFAAIAVAVALIAVDPASAQRFGRRAYYGDGYGYGYGSNPYYYGGSGYGYGWGNYPAYNRGWTYNNSGYYPGYSGWAYNNSQNYPEYSGAWWNTPAYGESAGTYGPGMQTGTYGQGMQGDYYSSTIGTSPSAGTMGQGQTMDGRVLINIRVPPNAEVWFDDQKTTQTGPVRSFITPALNPDHEFVYHIRARWTENGRQVEKTRRLDVHAGDRLFVNFMSRAQQGMGTPSGQYGATPGYGNEPGNRGENRSLEQRDQTLENRPPNAQENPDRTLENNRTNTTPNRTNTTPEAPPNKTNQPPVKQP